MARCQVGCVSRSEDERANLHLLTRTASAPRRPRRDRALLSSPQPRARNGTGERESIRPFTAPITAPITADPRVTLTTRQWRRSRRRSRLIPAGRQRLRESTRQRSRTQRSTTPSRRPSHTCRIPARLAVLDQGWQQVGCCSAPRAEQATRAAQRLRTAQSNNFAVHVQDGLPYGILCQSCRDAGGKLRFARVGGRGGQAPRLRRG